MFKTFKEWKTYRRVGRVRVSQMKMSKPGGTEIGRDTKREEARAERNEGRA